eukprot:TRINITY_DN10398_c0_g1_i1.p1 TRINITY_DN10398_c0_g1~~TRINITY_DN10398_c0_g1_i1.p1  ORF type:complete len:321 (-),score=31.52 TRINITY_DN10398_c0_g1_i1:221-1183(-)
MTSETDSRLLVGRRRGGFCVVFLAVGVSVVSRAGTVTAAADSSEFARLASRFPHANATRPHIFRQAEKERAQFEMQGFMVLRSALRPEARVAAREHFDAALWSPHRHSRPRHWLEVTRAGVYDGNVSIFLPAASRGVRYLTYRIKGVHEAWPSPLSNIAFDEGLLRVVEELIGGKPQRIFSLLMERGTEQGLHDDTWYGLGSDRPAGMVGVWVALDDTDHSNGPLVYVPGSHLRREEVKNPSGKRRSERLSFPMSTQEPRFLQEEAYRAIRTATNLVVSEQPFYAHIGDIAIWHERLLHGGGNIRDSRRTRRSLVLHYIA